MKRILHLAPKLSAKKHGGQIFESEMKSTITMCNQYAVS